jgi:hypothetical protein
MFCFEISPEPTKLQKQRDYGGERCSSNHSFRDEKMKVSSRRKEMFRIPIPKEESRSLTVDPLGPFLEPLT